MTSVEDMRGIMGNDAITTETSAPLVEMWVTIICEIWLDLSCHILQGKVFFLLLTGAEQTSIDIHQKYVHYKSSINV